MAWPRTEMTSTKLPLPVITHRINLVRFCLRFSGL
jgi:hypothetical protein